MIRRKEEQKQKNHKENRHIWTQTVKAQLQYVGKLQPILWACRRNFKKQVRVMEPKAGRQRKLDTVAQGAGREANLSPEGSQKIVARYI